MGFYIDTNGNYYEGDRIGNDEVVPQRPSVIHVWTGVAWEQGPLPTPSVVSMRQARLAMLRTGRLAAVNAAVAAADEETKITWEYSQEVHRAHPFVATLAVALSLTEQDLDDLFTLAATL